MVSLENALKIESWTLYGLGVLVVIARFVSRRMKLGKWRLLTIEDYLMFFALINFTGVAVTINKVAHNGSSYLPADVAENLSPEGRQAAIYGSIMTFVLEVFTITALWTVKACLLLLYARLTKGALSRQYFMVKLVAVYCAVTYVLVIFMFVFFWCSPHVEEYWRVPYKYEQCATYFNHLVFATAFNISSDLMLFFIPIPIIIRTRLPMKRKIILCFILGLGVFNICAAILNRYFNFKFKNTYIFLFWYVAEVAIAMWVGNLPLCYPLLRWAVGSKDTTSEPTPPYIVTIGSERMRPRRNPNATLLSTRGGGTTWDKLDDGVDNSAEGSQNAQESTLVGGGSDNGSQIELVLQGHRLNHHHETTVSSNGNESDDARLAEEGRQRPSTRNSRSKDKITVVRTVDVSSK